uniref:Coiled-coil domain-containing protein 57 n=1 Tax=Knipowitschia caucasica TaxID=637954 RepID=A0AAV2LCY1_KNICA
MELEWEKKSAQIQSKHYLDHERLIYELTAARDNANAELVETKIKVQEQTVLLQCVTKERDLALQGCNTDTGFVASEEMTALKQQNYRLQTVVSEMRKQMEELSCTTPPRPPESENNVTKEVEKKYVQNLDPKVTRVNEKSPKFTSVCSCGRASGEKSLSSQLRSRLKQAALCIARLNRDRQQLIELCNRLRAQVCAAEPLQSHSNTGQLQESTHNLKTDNSEEQESVGPERLRTQSSVPSSSRLLQTDRQSAESLPSLSDLWALLDQRPSHDFSDAAEDQVDSVGSQGPVPGGAQMQVCGVSAPVHKPPTVKPPQKKIKMKNTSAKIRNYNIKD